MKREIIQSTVGFFEIVQIAKKEWEVRLNGAMVLWQTGNYREAKQSAIRVIKEINEELDLMEKEVV